MTNLLWLSALYLAFHVSFCEGVRMYFLDIMHGPEYPRCVTELFR